MNWTSKSGKRWPLILALAVAAALAIWFVTAEPDQPGDAESLVLVQDQNPSVAEFATDTDGPAAGLETDSTAGDFNPEQVRVTRDRAFISYAFPVLSTWESSAVRPLLSAQTTMGNTDEELEDVMTILSARLGKLQYFETPQPASADTTGLPGTGDADLQHYQFTAYYEAGAAEVDLVLHQQQEASSLYSFNIQVPN